MNAESSRTGGRTGGGTAEKNGRRYLAVWFPFLPTDRLRREEGRCDLLNFTYNESISLIVRVGFKSSSSLESNLNMLSEVLETDISNHKRTVIATIIK